MRDLGNAVGNARFYLSAILIFSLSTSPSVAGPSETRTSHSGTSQETNFTLEGKINKQSPGKLTISAEGNIIFRVAYNDKTEIKRKDGSAGSAQDLRVGMTVRVGGDLTESGEIVAQKIEIQSENPPK